MSEYDIDFWSKVAVMKDEDGYHIWYRRLRRSLRRLFMIREQRQAEIDEERRISQEVANLQL